MLKLFAPQFIKALGQLSDTASLLRFPGADSNPPHQLMADAAFSEAREVLDELPLSPVLRSQWRRLGKAVAHDPFDRQEAALLFREFSRNLMVELSAACLLMIPNDQAPFYLQKEPPFGKEVEDKFASASKDIADASRCLALDQWTAAVFHLMRVLEHGLRALAADVGLPPDAMALENWKNVIEQIEKKIRELEAAPKSTHKSEVTVHAL